MNRDEVAAAPAAAAQGTVAQAYAFGRDVAARFLEDDCLPMAATIAYYALLSIFPLLLGASALATFFLERQDVQAAISEALRAYLPPEAVAAVLRNVDEAVRARGTVGVAAIAVFLWSSSAVAGAARHSLNRVWGVGQERPFWRRKMLEIATTLLFGGILAASLSVSLTLSIVDRFIPASLSDAIHAIPGAGAGRVVIPLVLPMLVFLLAYRLLPNRPIRWRWLWPGALVATLLFEGARRVVFWGVETFTRYQLVYGSLAGVIVFLLWIYVVAAIFLLGAEVSRRAASPPPWPLHPGVTHAHDPAG
ncbi:MAG: YihY/virulence factor BrkB family protein [Armatimonadota bacterium]|nr:YihY/virulence factor BrkB family protein [Armatimonadota bacterium]MDR5697694.1 YihY/virulence factor BrkB family protein [Armatimonadota bacterium]